MTFGEICRQRKKESLDARQLDLIRALAKNYDETTFDHVPVPPTINYYYNFASSVRSSIL